MSSKRRTRPCSSSASTTAPASTGRGERTHGGFISIQLLTDLIVTFAAHPGTALTVTLGGK